MDIQIVRALFSHCIKASEILNIDERFHDELISTRERLSEQKIGKYGHLQEWLEYFMRKTSQTIVISHIYLPFSLAIKLPLRTLPSWLMQPGSH